MTTYVAPPDLLKGRVVLVTGAGDGIGRCAALEYARLGAEVVLLGRTGRKLEGVYDEIVDAGLPEPVIQTTDLASAEPDDYATLASQIGEQLGRLDGILHNAAELDILTPVEYIERDSWERALAVNATAPLLLTQACLPLLRRQDSTVIFTTDACARKPKGYWGAYAVSKAAALNLALMLAIELQNTPIRVNVVDPGPTRTGLRLRTHPGASIMSVPPPEAFMSLYAYLMGPDSAALRGAVLDAGDWLDPNLDDRGPRQAAPATEDVTSTH